MNCCATDHFDQTTPEIHEEICMAAMSETDCCVRCGNQGRPVSKKTVLLMLKPELLTQEISESFRFCSTRDCPVVYFEDDGDQQFTLFDLRIRVGLKVNEDPIPLCYCFGFDESHAREQITRTGETTIPETISRLVGAGLCACDAHNPSGMCCLGEVNKAAKRLKSERPESSTKLT